MKKTHTHNNKKNTLEVGDIYFFYRPKAKSLIETAKTHSLSDVQRFYIVLHKQKSRLYRLIIIGAKKLPAISNKHEKNWGLVDLVTASKKKLLNELDEKFYSTKTRGKRYLPHSFPAEEGVYCIITLIFGVMTRKRINFSQYK